MTDVRVDRIGEAFATAALDLGADEDGIHVSHDQDLLELLIEHDGRRGSIRVDVDGIPAGDRARAGQAELAARSCAAMLGIPLPPLEEADPADVPGSDQALRAAAAAEAAK